MKKLIPLMGVALILILLSTLTFAQKVAPSRVGSQVSDTVPVLAAEQGLTKVAFSRLRSRDIAKLYPALKTFVLAKEEDGGEQMAFPPTALIADMRDKAANLKLIFLEITDKSWCRDPDNQGCPFFVFTDEGRGYGQNMGDWVKGPLYLLEDKNKISLIFCSFRQNNEWSFEGHLFKFKAPYAGKDVPACH
jgi:hypothetical protein